MARLAADERLRQRYDELRQTGAPLAAAFDALLEQAPLARLRAALPADEPLRRPARRFAGIALRELAAGVVVGLLAAGAALWAASTFGLIGGQEDWRTAVVDYTNLYTNETFSPFNPDSALQAAELSAVGAKVGANLTPENVALPGLRFTTAFMLSYEGSPLGVIAYVDPSGAPVLLLHPRQSRAGRADALGTPRRSRRSPGGRAADAAIWSSAASPRTAPSLLRKRSKSGFEPPQSDRAYVKTTNE